MLISVCPMYTLTRTITIQVELKKEDWKERKKEDEVKKTFSRLAYICCRHEFLYTPRMISFRADRSRRWVWHKFFNVMVKTWSNNNVDAEKTSCGDGNWKVFIIRTKGIVFSLLDELNMNGFWRKIYFEKNKKRYFRSVFKSNRSD